MIPPEEYKRIWKNLVRLSDEDNIIEFYKEYIKYIEKDCESYERRALLKMAKLVVKKLSA
jgi:hypothetical protein